MGGVKIRALLVIPLVPDIFSTTGSPSADWFFVCCPSPNICISYFQGTAFSLLYGKGEGDRTTTNCLFGDVGARVDLAEWTINGFGGDMTDFSPVCAKTSCSLPPRHTCTKFLLIRFCKKFPNLLHDSMECLAPVWNPHASFKLYSPSNSHAISSASKMTLRELRISLTFFTNLCRLRSITFIESLLMKDYLDPF